MPEMNGVQMSKEVHKLYPGIRIILISAYADFQYAQEAIQYGVCSYILKPMNFEKIKQICDFIENLSLVQTQHNSFRSMVHDVSFRAMAKKAFENRNRSELESFLELSENRRVSALDFYSYLISILLEVAQDKSAQHLFSEHDISAVLRQENPEACRQFIIQGYERLQLYMNGGMNDTHSLIERIRHYINLNYTTSSISTCEIASALQISEVHLCRVFKQYEQNSIMKYIQDKRIEAARKLLADDSLLMHDIARRVGYENEKYFYNVFKKCVGVSPGVYRDRLRRGEVE